MAEIDTSKTVSELEIDGVNVQLAGSGSGGELPEYMSAKNFTFDGNACTGYVGDNTLPEIIIPKSYSTITSTETVAGAKVLDKENLSMSIYDFQSVTFSDGGTNTQTYTSTSQLQNLSTDFPNDCYLVSMQGSNPFSFDLLQMASDMQMLQFPVIINGQSFSNGMTAFDYIMQNNITDVNFGGDVEVIKSFIDGDTYQVTSVSGKYINEGDSGGFVDYQNRIILLSNLKTVGNYAFMSCTSLTSIEIPSSVTSIGGSVFRDCSSLTSIKIPSSVTSIGTYAFAYCSNLSSVTFGDNSQLIDIGSRAFQYCFSLISITIPSSVTSIGVYAFTNCSNLTTMTILATTPPILGSTGAISTATRKIYIPAGTLSAYQSATNWSNFASLFEELPA